MSKILELVAERLRNAGSLMPGGSALVETVEVLVGLLAPAVGAARARQVAGFAGDRLCRSGLIAGQGPHADALEEIANGCRAAYEFPNQPFRLGGDMARILCDHLQPERAGQYGREPSPGAEFDAYVRGEGAA